MTKKIFQSIMLAAASVLLASLIIITGCLYDYYRQLQEAQLQDELHLAACGVEAGGRDYLDRLAPPYRLPSASDYRLTWVAADGTVLFDTHAPAEEMENHAGRIEVREAFANGESSSVRYSSTLTQRTMYCARALSDGTVLRASMGQATELALVLGMLQPILIAAVLAIAVSTLLARRMSKRIVAPLNTLDLDRPLDNDVYEELSPLLRRIQQQRGQISAQLRELRAKTDEFEQITAHMGEGLVVLDREGTVLSINPAAQTIFGADRSCIRQDFLTVDRTPEMSQAIRIALDEGRSSTRACHSGREYQFDLSRIESDGAVIGAVLLAFDVTDQARAERNRREFTANVSHELKTPLQSIMGSAELLENGLVQPEDRQRFAGSIRAEAARLAALVEDIIHLSQLDEGAALPQAEVDLLAVAHQAADDLRERAEQAHATLSVSGEPTLVCGAPSLLYEMIYNLCDNAIKYNVEDGRVEVAVFRRDTVAVVRVKDTGIGIPPEYQSRVFERFFRVDKSRSKATGGTGLGLSIVKHIAQYHNAKITLESVAGSGTTVSVVFYQPES